MKIEKKTIKYVQKSSAPKKDEDQKTIEKKTNEIKPFQENVHGLFYLQSSLESSEHCSNIEAEQMLFVARLIRDMGIKWAVIAQGLMRCDSSPIREVALQWRVSVLCVLGLI